MSYYAGQQGSGQYPDEYASHSTPPTPRDPNYQPQSQWEQQPQSQHSQISDQMSQQALEQALEVPPPPQQPTFHQPLEDPQHLVPSQILPRGAHDLTPIRLLPVTGQPPGRSPPVEIKPVMLQVDTTLRSTAHPGSSTRPASRARHQHQFHPYQRPASASGQRREIEAHHHVRFASQTNTPQMHPGSAMHSPASARQTFASPSEYPQQVSSPAATRQTFASPPMSDYAQPGQQGASPSFVSTSPLGAPAEGAFAQNLVAQQQHAPPPTDERRYIIRADTHYDPGTRVLTALLELPGLKRRDVSITLATTPFNRLRQVTVRGQSRPPFLLSTSSSSSSSTTAPAPPMLRERKYGRFARAFPVPIDTQPDDVDATMEDGVLVLKIQCGLPAASPDEHEIPIR
ncbi:hypothetical protein C8F04DRAFT_1243207 [Mycena alexandri]|uniref:SHSP domain-containing protein n=1 Tax=Mycena alexandri TaxID=1745969 RepID=A0AAD6WLH2_9AGAR|nr:hypothetical protein C8F04DRAFT_1243207 [Mycena alexandri]